MNKYIDKLINDRTLTRDEFAELIEGHTVQDSEYLFQNALKVRKEHYGLDVYIRGLVEVSNYCKNDCFYCGIRKSNKYVKRYKLTKEEILGCCKEGYRLGFRTFVFQGGEADYMKDDEICSIISTVKGLYPDCAVTLSLGEKSYKSYLSYYNAGADRYLLRHETADDALYARLHPQTMSLENRKRCLYDLKRIGYQTGTGFMVGAPFATAQNLADDLLFIKELDPQMVGIGPFIPHSCTPFADFPAGRLELTLFLIAVIRLMLPAALIPSTTALATIHPDGRRRGLYAGANVVMPNLSPSGMRSLYTLYDGKACAGQEAAEGLSSLIDMVEKAGFKIVTTRGDYKG